MNSKHVFFEQKIYIRNKNHLIIGKLLIIFVILVQIVSQNKIEFNAANITLKIKGIGYKNIFGFDKSSVTNTFPSNSYPIQININGESKEVNYSYYFNKSVNLVELIWNKDITDCKSMFRKCSDIFEIDLFNFKTPKVTTMRNMFAYCSMITSLDLSNFDTSLVKNMRSMFYECSNLTYLNLSSFNTSRVSTIYSMFYSCKSLIELNLSNFDTSKVTTMQFTFHECESLRISKFQ